MNNKLKEKVTQFLAKEFQYRVGDISIFVNDDGTYEFFNKYYIKENPNGYEVTCKYNSDVRLFSVLKNAVAWCIFDQRNKYAKAARIEYIDKMIGSTELSILLHRKLIQKSKDIENKLIYSAKLNEDQLKRKTYIIEMAGYINESRQWQTQKFATK